MIKRKLNPRMTPTIAQIKKVKDKLSEVGIKFFNNKDWDNFQVYPMDDRRGEGSTYDTIGNSDKDLQDALETGLDMAKRLGKGAPNFSNIGKKVNPECRTIKVRRKVSMGKGKRPRILQVRRKVCNPSKEIETELDKLEGKKVSLYEKNQLLMKGDLLIPDWFYSTYRVLNRNSGIIETFETTDVKSIDKTNIYL